MNVPYVLVGLYATHFGEAYRMAQEAGATDMFDGMLETLPICLTHVMPSVHPVDLLVGVAAGAALKAAVYLKGKNAKKYPHGQEFGTARWGKPKDIEPYIAPKFEDNVILTKTERLMMSNRPKRANMHWSIQKRENSNC
ncbi:type IV secretion system protein VirD4 [Lachnospiraceae bacterium XBB1006]|nr:type IV secretion system protein VirD4 [Lachnospiraceae bacterium XBB1006]